MTHRQKRGTNDQHQTLLPSCRATTAVLSGTSQQLNLQVNGLNPPLLAMSIDFPAEEVVILNRWREMSAFERQVELSRGRKPYTFYDGPPFATGLPHYGHLLASTIKDIIPRYWSLKGYYVERRFGWDTHGVPIEYEIDKKLGMSGLEAVQKLGIDKYNEECKGIVMRFAAEWRETVDRLGRWVDFDNDYKVCVRPREGDF